MPSHPIDLNYYDERLIAYFALVVGEGFLSPGGPQEVKEIVKDLDLHNKQILDIGCGVGGPAMVLTNELGAAHVTGIDVQPMQVERARQRIQQSGLSDRISLHLVNSGPLPFEDNSFDIVFSKEAINEVADKEGLFREIFRVLKPGGWLAAGDWLKGDAELSEQFYVWEKIQNLPIEMEHISNIQPMLTRCGFESVTLRPRNDWYRQEAQAEFFRSAVLFRQQILSIQKDERLLHLSFKYWLTTLQLLDSNEFCPAHFRAQKPL